MRRTRRMFLEDVGNGMLIAGLGATLASDLGVSQAFADEESRLDFGKFQPLVGLMQETPAEKLQVKLVKMLQTGETTLKELTAAAALANAETFGGQDYVGYHTEMALLPALQMSAELPKDRQALPVLKVLFRNAQRIQKSGMTGKRTLKPVVGAKVDRVDGRALRESTRAADMRAAEELFAGQAKGSNAEAFNALLWAVEDDINVHRFVLAHRAFGLIDVAGNEFAHTLLRQCVRFCVDNEQNRIRKNRPVPPIRKLLPAMLDQYHLLSRDLGDRIPDDAWVERTAKYIYEETGDRAMDTVAAALADGISPEAVGQAITLACNHLVLAQDRLSDGTTRVHGATPGVHSSDAANAWRNMVRLANKRNTITGLMVAAYHTGGYKRYKQEPFPHADQLSMIGASEPQKLLLEAEDAIKSNDQHHACAAIHKYALAGGDSKPVFQLMLHYTISEDGRLHGEKYYRTVTEEFATSRPAIRGQFLLGLARVTASAYGFDAEDRAGYRAPGYEEACRLLQVRA